MAGHLHLPNCLCRKAEYYYTIAVESVGYLRQHGQLERHFNFGEGLRSILGVSSGISQATEQARRLTQISRPSSTVQERRLLSRGLLSETGLTSGTGE